MATESVKPKRVKKVKVIDQSAVFDMTKYQIEKEVENAKGKIELKTVTRPEYLKGIGKCRLYAALKLGVSIERIAESYPVLNGKKIDGIVINDLIDRFGWANGQQLNRIQVAQRYKMISPSQIELASEKLVSILLSEDVEVAYAEYLKGKLDVLNKEIADEMTGE